MPPTKLLIFGNPKAGTSRMVAYNGAEYLQMRHSFPPGFMKNIAGVEAFATAVSE